MDTKKTEDFYKTMDTDYYICKCDYCQNYIKEIKHSYPLLADYLQSIGVDIEKPFETMPLEPDEEGYIEYIGVQYIVLGSKDSFEPTIVSDVEIGITESHPRTNVEDEHFVIELQPIRLKWVMEKPNTTKESVMRPNDQDDGWLTGRLYFAPKDKRVIVKRPQSGLGYTVNLGNKWTWIFRIAFVMAIVILVRVL